MTNSSAFSRGISLAVMAAAAVLMLAMTLAPQASLYAG